jgi:hypothetical protein
MTRLRGRGTGRRRREIAAKDCVVAVCVLQFVSSIFNKRGVGALDLYADLVISTSLSSAHFKLPFHLQQQHQQS